MKCVESRRNYNDIQLSNEGVKQVIQQKKMVYKTVGENQSEENKVRYKNTKN